MPKQAFPVSLRSPTQDMGPTNKSELSGYLDIQLANWTISECQALLPKRGSPL